MYFRVLERAIVVTLILILIGCTSKLSKIEVDVASKLTEGKGYLLLEVNTDISLNTVEIRGESRVDLTEKDLREGSNYILVQLDAGEYYINSVTRKSGYWKFSIKSNEEYYKFSVNPNSISYIGTLAVRSNEYTALESMILINNSSFALEFMHERFPNILQSRVMIYSGPGTDAFLENMHKPENASEITI